MLFRHIPTHPIPMQGTLCTQHRAVPWRPWHRQAVSAGVAKAMLRQLRVELAWMGMEKSAATGGTGT